MRRRYRRRRYIWRHMSSALRKRAMWNWIRKVSFRRWLRASDTACSRATWITCRPFRVASCASTSAHTSTVVTHCLYQSGMRVRDAWPVRRQTYGYLPRKHCHSLLAVLVSHQPEVGVWAGMSDYTVSQTKVPTFKLSVTLSNLNRFSKFLHCWKAYEICYKTMWHYPPHLRHVAKIPWEIKNSNFLQILVGAKSGFWEF